MIAPEETRFDLVRLGPADAGEVLTLQRAAYVTEAAAHDDLALPPLVQTLAELREELADGDVLAVGLRAAGRLVASVRVRVDGDVGHLGRLVVVPDLQRRGLGTRLLLAVESVVPPGTRRILLFTGERSLGNLTLYRGHGYLETHRTPVGGRGYRLVHLAKDLTGAGPGHPEEVAAVPTAAVEAVPAVPAPPAAGVRAAPPPATG